MKSESLLWIEWQDSCSTGGFWVGREDAVTKDLSTTSIGWLVDETEDSITIGSHFGKAFALVAGHVTIPKCAITGRWEVNVT